jgi:FG-GAP-like repeat/FG-GAP repeat
MKTSFQFILIGLAFSASSYRGFAQNPIFGLSSSPGVGSDPQCAIAADINGDGKLDLITANFHDFTLTVLTNDGSGNFVLASSPNINYASYSVCAVDVNGNGKVDLVSAQISGTLTLSTNNGNGTFGSNIFLHGNYFPDFVCAVDVNGDGKLDLISANNYGDVSSSTLSVFTNDGHGGFVLASSPGVGFQAACVVAADVNGDGNVDLVSANYGDMYANRSTLTVLTNDGSGGFVIASSPQVPDGTISLVATDVNEDGKVDLICANSSTNTLTVLTNDGTGGFVIASTLNVGPNPVSVYAADMNGDDKVDLICANFGTNTLTVLTNDGSGGFVLALTLTVGNAPNSVCAADVNGDGKLDLICANSGDSTLTVFTNATIFSPPTSTPPLTIIPSGLGMQVSWPSDAPGWSLQQNPDLITANWGPSGYSGFNILDDGTNKSLTLPTTQGSLFFRLLHP